MARGAHRGLSGPAIRAIALEQVAAVCAAVDSRDRHGRDRLRARRRGVHGRRRGGIAVGTENFLDPAAGRRIGAELAVGASAL